MNCLVTVLSVLAFLLGAPLYSPRPAGVPPFPRPHSPHQQLDPSQTNANYQGEK